METAPRRILVIQLRRIGDVLLTTPALRALRASFPGARLDFLVEKPSDQALRGNPDISEILVYSKKDHLRWLGEIRGRGYDWVIDYLGTPRSMFMAAVSGARLRAGPEGVFWRFGYTDMMKRGQTPAYAAVEKIRMLSPFGVRQDLPDILPSIAIPPELAAESRDFLKNAGLKTARGGKPPVIALAPESRKPARRYPPESWARVAKALAEKTGGTVFVTFGPGEKTTAERICALAGTGARLAPEFRDLRGLAAFFSLCDLALANCNGPKHIAVAAGTPTLTVHGSSNPACWTPPGCPQHRYVRLETLPCIGCGKNECPRGLECMTALPSDRIVEEALTILRL
ncbi:MAG: glycosyltransferase family 9 protein [Elusimicrobiales bacterium]|nr:glycosyltransferase family 9 protein [Elusimicrobiales bacterium]